MSKPENPVPGYKHLLIEPYTPTIGAVVHDFDLANIEDSDARGELRQALAEFQVLFFRKQKLSPAEQVAVARVFGDPDKAKAFFPRHETQKFIEVLEARPGVTRYGTDQWHADITFVANPPTGTVLYSHIVSEFGGDTHNGTVRRETVSNIEIWCECFGKDASAIKPADSYAIASIVKKIEGWDRDRDNGRVRLAIYGQQRVYRRTK